jgi:Arc/MetJ-type ribon-helix-helix transcriptional regulator
MKSVQIELSDKLAGELDRLVKAGWFRNADEVMRLAIIEFVRRYKFELMERFQREDIAWALGQKGAKQ